MSPFLSTFYFFFLNFERILKHILCVANLDSFNLLHSSFIMFLNLENFLFSKNLSGF
jgi:hypothetical protein